MPTSHSSSKPSAQYWILGLFLLFLFALGGSSRTDVESLAILQPLSVIISAFACLTLRSEHWNGRRWLLSWAAAIFTIAFLSLAPLPPAFWQSLAGRQDLVHVEKLVGLSDIWRPLGLVPTNAWHAFISLFVPLAVVLLGVQLDRHDLFRLLPLVITLVTISGLLGLLQVIGDPQGILYFYRITNNGSAVGAFANRNHAATLLTCLFPMLAVYISVARTEVDARRTRLLLAASLSLVLVPLILLTGSRSGLVGALIGLGVAPLLYRPPTHSPAARRAQQYRINALAALGGVAVVSLAALTYFFSQAEALERVFAGSSGEDTRSDFLIVSLELLRNYFPAGSGSGSFAEAYKMAEPTSILDASYLNRAHNDWVEVAVTFGLPGAVAMFVATAGYGLRTYRFWCSADGSRRAVAFGRLATVIIAIIAIASGSDYPLRTPTMMGLFAIWALWLTQSGDSSNSATCVTGRGI